MFVKNKNIYNIVYIFILVSFLFSYYWWVTNSKNILNDYAENLVESALKIDLQKTDYSSPDAAYQINLQAFEKVKEGNYRDALEIVITGLHQFPQYFGFQKHLATLLGDYSSYFSDPIKESMLNKSKEIFNKLMKELDGHSRSRMYSFKNEYYFRFGMHCEQYELGLERVKEYFNTADWQDEGIWGYYSQGVGAANYAKQLLIAGNKELALNYAQKALVAWAQFFSHDNSYYNAYVHYALALGILGYKDEMVKALQRGREIIKKDHVEFNEVEVFFRNFETN